MLPPLLRIIKVVTQSIPALKGLDHVSQAISVCLDTSSDLSFTRACALGSLQLMQRVWGVSEWVSSRNLTLSSLLKSDRHYHCWSFEWGLQEAAKRGDLEIFRWMMEHFSGCRVSKSVINQLGSGGHRDLLECLLEYERGVQCLDIDQEHCHSISSVGEVMAAAAAGGHNELVFWMSSDRFDPTDKSKVLQEVACHGDLNLLQWLMEVWRRQKPRHPRLEFAAKGGNVEMMSWLEEKFGSAGKSRALVNAAEHGHVDVAKWLAENDFLYQEKNALIRAAEHGHLAMVEWLIENTDARTTDAFGKAVEKGHLEVAQYLHRHGLHVMYTSLMMYETAEKGDLKMIQWLSDAFAHKPRLDIFKTDRNRNPMMDAAAEGGHLDVMKYLHEVALSRKDAKSASGKRKRNSSTAVSKFLIPECTQRTMALAVTNGHIHVVEWIQASYDLTPGAKSMDKAAEGGHLEMLKWLDQNTDCECTVSAMNEAARGGHLQVVKWLHSNRSEGCTEVAVHSAASMGHLHVVKWLLENRAGGCTDKAMAAAARGGHFDVVLYLYHQRPEGSRSTSCSPGMVSNRYIVAWLQENFTSVDFSFQYY